MLHGTKTRLTKRGTASLPQTTQSALFNVDGGKILVHAIVGEVTTVIQTQADNTKLVANPDTGADVDLCAVNDITADAVGTMYNITGDFSDAMQATTSGAVETLGDYKPVIVAPGTIDLSCAASNTGSVKWSILWEPLDVGAKVTAA
jgi:hypothetical protein